MTRALAALRGAAILVIGLPVIIVLWVVGVLMVGWLTVTGRGPKEQA